MVPDLDLQLQTAIKALGDNIKPAVDPDDKVAVEQLGIVMATLAMVRERLPSERRFIRRVLGDEIGVAVDVGAAVGNEAVFTDDIAAARRALADPELDTAELENIRSALTSRTVSVIAEAGAAGLDALTPVLLKGAKPPLERLRAWCIPSGFEPYASEIKALDSLI